MWQIYFSDFFEVSRKIIEEEGFFDISLLNDLPLFIDPFLIFCSKKEEYKELHNEIIRYMVFLRDYSIQCPRPTRAMLTARYKFSEVKQNYLGFCEDGNSGSGLGNDFAIALHTGLKEIFSDFGEEKVTKSPHLEKLCLVKERVGKDNISDFTTNLIQHYLLALTQDFARKYIKPCYCKEFKNIQRVKFNYDVGVWEAETFYLPCYNNDYVILTPTDMLVRAETWINKKDLYSKVQTLGTSLPDEVLRFQVNEYFKSFLSKKPSREEKAYAAQKTVAKFPQLIDYYIKSKEDDAEGAIREGYQEVGDVKQVFIEQLQNLVYQLQTETDFYKIPLNSYQEALQRVLYLKHVIEDCDGYRWFYNGDQPIRREADLHIMYKLVCYDTFSDANSEVNNGRGPVDFKLSLGRRDGTLVEFKLSRTLKKNLEKQVEVYKDANKTDKVIKAILFFTDEEQKKTDEILNELGLKGKPNIVLIDARPNKLQASKAS
ncbi:MAG: hypothetical protein Q8865_05170 [Bacillota bacterium]|nr:hypothetical protein [Bacillota bacterium]